ncbi:MAG: hypothetical protein WC091_05600 [Sulfuricellaceae bacterium]
MEQPFFVVAPLVPIPDSLRLGHKSRRLSGMPCTRKTAHSSPFN